MHTHKDGRDVSNQRILNSPRTFCNLASNTADNDGVGRCESSEDLSRLMAEEDRDVEKEDFYGVGHGHIRTHLG